MPDSCQEPDSAEVDHLPRNAAAVASEWNIDIFAEPGAQGDVPSPPELRKVAGSIRIIKVVRKPESQHSGNTDRHVGISAEIIVQLERIETYAQPGKARCFFGDGRDLRKGKSQRICQQHLFKQAP